MIGTLLDGKYEIRALLGAGAMGSVYEAIHTGTARRVAIKVINSGDVKRDQKLVGRFQREAKAAGSIATQHITQVLDTGVDRDTGLPFMVMEFLQGEDLQHLFKRLGPVSPELALRLVSQACVGLQKAHEAGVVHRDIKPANLFLTGRDSGDLIVKVLDFGIAKIKMDQANETESAGLTKTGSMLGSPLYMSPEQALGAKDIDHRADIFSLGVVLYQALTGRAPFQHIEALGQLIISICHHPPPDLQSLAPWVPAEVAQIVLCALARDPRERFQSAEAMLDAIRVLLPNGWFVMPDMLVPMAPEERAGVAPRLSIRPASIPPPPGMMGRGSFTSGHPAAIGSSTAGALAQSNITPKRSSPIAIGIAVAGLAAAAAVVYAVRSVGGPKPEIAATEAQAAHAARPVEVTPAQAAPPEAPTTRSVKLVIVPADATVEVDGKPTTAKDGIVEIKGGLGTIHDVKIAKGSTEQTGEVVVTEAGASPPKMEIRGVVSEPTAAAKAPGKAAPPAAAPSAKPAASAAPVKGPTPGIVDNFD